MRIMLMVSAVASLAACGQAAEQRDANKETSDPIAVETPIPVEPDGGIGDGALPLDEAQGIAANEIPERFHGVWDALTGTLRPRVRSSHRNQTQRDRLLRKLWACV